MGCVGSLEDFDSAKRPSPATLVRERRILVTDRLRVCACHTSSTSSTNVPATMPVAPKLDAREG